MKLVGNTIKSKRISAYVEAFIDRGVRLLLRGKGQDFIEEYYDTISKIYNYQIPLKDIASKAKVKKTVDDYIADCQTLTKAGRPKSRQAWMELAINAGINPDLGDTLYYINTGKAKSQSDVKKVTHYYQINEDGTKQDVITKIEKAYKEYKKERKDKGKEPLPKDEFIVRKFPTVVKDDEIILNAQLLPREIVEAEEDTPCNLTIEYNVPKYIEQFNKRITPLLVCFKKDIRNKILVTKPSDRQYFTQEECELSSGEPNRKGDQDTYEQLMTMEDKEIAFWKAHPEFKIPYLKECGMDWNQILDDYNKRKEEEILYGVDKEREKFNKLVEGLSKQEIEDMLDGVIPDRISAAADLDNETLNFVSKTHPEFVFSSIYDILEQGDKTSDYDEASYDIEEEEY